MNEKKEGSDESISNNAYLTFTKNFFQTILHLLSDSSASYS